MIAPEKLQALEAKFKALKIQPSDITEQFLASDKLGGCKIDDASDVVYLRHIPTGLEVRCKESHDPELNRFLARQMLANKIQESLTGVSDSMREFERIKKRKARLGRKANQKW
jgi:protein subunit release factor B